MAAKWLPFFLNSLENMDLKNALGIDKVEVNAGVMDVDQRKQLGSSST